MWFYDFNCFGCFCVTDGFRVYALECFGYFCYTDGHFMDFVILRDSLALPWCLDFYCLGGLRVSEVLD